MTFGMLGTLTFDAAFFSALASIVLIDLILAGDNAVVIAMAVRSLPREHRRRGILLGAAAAVLLRVIAAGKLWLHGQATRAESRRPAATEISSKPEKRGG
ncbi:MAG: TerC family protein [Candidatus Methylomirabilia bacterium]